MRSPRTTHIFAGVLLDLLDRPQRIRPLGGEECPPGAPDRFRLAERTGRPKDGEGVVRFGPSQSSVSSACMTHSMSGEVAPAIGRAQEGHLGAVVAGDARIVLRIGGDDDIVENA